MKRSRMVWLSTAPSLSRNEKRGSRSVDRLPRSPLKRIRRLDRLGARASGGAAAAAAGAVPLPLRVVQDLAALHRDLVGDPLRDALQVVGTPLQLVGTDLEIFTRAVAGLRRVEERRDGADQETEYESHLSSLPEGFCEHDGERGKSRATAGEEYLRFPERTGPPAPDLAERLGGEHRRHRQDPGGEHALRATERGADRRGNAHRDEGQRPEAGRHR